MVKCCFEACNSESRRKEEGITFHRFPQDQERRMVWLQAMGKPAEWQQSDKDRLYSKHFDESCFYKTNGNAKRLLYSAIPNMFTISMQVQPSTPAQMRKPVKRKLTYEPSKSSPQPSTSGLQDTPRKANLRHDLQQEILKRHNVTKKLKLAQQSLRRCKKRLKTMKVLMKDLRNKNLSTLEHSTILECMPKVKPKC